MDGMSPIAEEKVFAQDPTVLTCMEYSVKNVPGTMISSSRTMAFSERDCLSSPRKSLP